jgi:hypothetical protein
MGVARGALLAEAAGGLLADPNPPARAQGRKLSERRPALPASPAHDA